MNQKIIYTLFLLSLSLLATAQPYLYPVKINHKWGYINQRGKLIVEPKYDLIGLRELAIYDGSKIASSYRLVQLDDKLGLINRKKQEVLSPSYQRIRPLSDGYFAVVKDSLFIVIDSTENVVINELYLDVQYLGKSSYSDQAFFKVRNNKLWGIHQIGKGLVIPMKYRNIDFLDVGQAHFKVLPDGQGTTFGVLNLEDKWILPPIYSNFKSCGQNFIATLYEGKLWGASDTLGRVLFAADWLEFRPHNAHLMTMIDQKEQHKIYSFKEHKILKVEFTYDSIQPLDERFVKSSESERYNFINEDGKAVLDSNFSAILPLEYPLYKVLGRKGFGIFDISKRQLVLPYTYRRIENFKGNTAKVQSRFTMTYGLINRKMEEIIPPNYRAITVEGKKVKARNGRKMSIYELDDSGEVIGYEDHDKVSTIQVKRRSIDEYEEASSIRNSRFTAQVTPFFELFATTFPLDSFPWQWIRNDEQQRQLIYKSIEKEVVLHDAQRIIVTNPPVNLGFISFGNAKAIKKGIFKILPRRAYRQMKFYNLQTGNAHTQNTFTGIRRHDFERALPCAAAVTARGKMVLVDKKGALLNEQIFTYIGEFKHGLARVCVGGELQEISDPSDDKYLAENLAELWKKFCFDAIPANIAEKKDGIVVEAKQLLVAAFENEQPKWGFIDTLGRLQIEVQYDYVRDIFEGQMEAVKNRNWGVIDTNNNTIIPFEYGHISNYYGSWKINKRSESVILFNRKGWELCGNCYEQIEVFKEGFSRVKKEGKWGFIDDEGKEIVPCEYEAVRDFSEALAAVKKEGKWAFLNTKGALVFELKEGEEVGDFKEGKCWIKRAGLYGYIDKKGKTLIAPKYKRAFDFNKNYARVVAQKKTALIDTTGNFVIPPTRFQIIQSFNEYGLAVAMENYQSGKKGIINRQGTIVAPFEYRSIEDFKEEVAIVSDGKKYGFLHLSGELIIPIQYEQALAFSDGFALIKRGKYSSWEYIDQTGKRAFERSFPIAFPFENGYASVQLDQGDPTTKKVLTKQGEFLPIQADFTQKDIFGLHTESPPNYGHNYYYGDKKGNNLFDQYFQEINPFVGDYAFVQQYRRRAIINKNGMMTLRPKYLAVDMLGDGFVLVHPPAFGIINHEGETVLPPIFDYVLLVSGEIYRVEQGERIGYVNNKGEWIWELQN